MLDREIQRKILEALADLYPQGFYNVEELIGLPTSQEHIALANVQYLAEHGLVFSGYTRRQTIGDNGFLATGETCITAQGLDFLAADGGLSAILGVVTVKLDASQWAELLASKVESLQGVSHEERSSIAKALRNLPAKAIETVSSKMLDWAVDHAQDALPLLRMLLSQAAA